MNRVATDSQPRPENVAGEAPPGSALRADDPGWAGSLALVALPAICCGLPLLVVALLATGAGAWLAANGSLLAIAAMVLAVGLLSARYVRTRRSR